MPSSDATFDEGAVGETRLVDAAALCAGANVFGLLWLDDKLDVVETFGSVVGHIPVGVGLTDSVAAFVGIEDDIKALRDDTDGMVYLPGVRVLCGGHQDGRFNFLVRWSDRDGRFVILVSRVIGPTGVEQAFMAESRLRRMAEAEVAAQAEIIRRTNEQLAIANSDLKEFAYVISHDLRAPLRGLRYAAANAKALLESDQIDGVGDELGAVIKRSQRMSQMLTGLFDYASIGRKMEVASQLDTGALAEEIAETTRLASGIDVVLEGTWPIFTTLAEPFDIVLRNLVDNAVKHHDRKDGRVVIACDNGENAITVTVRDDGPGIAPEWQQAVFQPFKQAADADHADGAGIGLSLVKRTLERFGGSIQLTSDPATSRGSTFRFVWPKTIKKSDVWAGC
ncbi:MAG: sensor histidine kinase [Hyphomicrobiaceae bacterium]